VFFYLNIFLTKNSTQKFSTYYFPLLMSRFNPQHALWIRYTQVVYNGLVFFSFLLNIPNIYNFFDNYIKLFIHHSEYSRSSQTAHNTKRWKEIFFESSFGQSKKMPIQTSFCLSVKNIKKISFRYLFLSVFLTKRKAHAVRVLYCVLQPNFIFYNLIDFYFYNLLNKLT